MKFKIRTKKNRLNKIKKSRRETRKIYKGGHTSVANQGVEEIKKEIEEENNIGENNKTNESTLSEKISDISSSLANSEIVEKSGQLAEGVAVKSLDKVGDVLGVDLSNPQDVSQKLDQINESLSNPENLEKIQDVAENVSEVGSVVLEAASPFIEPLVDKVIEEGTKAGSEIGKAAVKVALNTAEEIPGVGIVIGSVRSLGNIGEAMVSSANAATEVVSSTSDSVNGTFKNFNRLIKEKGKLLERTSNSIQNFFGSKESQDNNDQPQNINYNQNQNGGTRKKIARRLHLKKWKTRKH